MKDINFLKQNLIAHRGVHNDKDIPENSILAFKKAIENNYIIELDVHLLKDNQIIVMHDDDINRMTGKEGILKNLIYADLKEYSLSNTDEKIPTLQEVLSLVNGKVPIIIELKYDRKHGELERELVKVLDNYNGKFAVKSFNPWSIKWIKKNRPNYIRGLLIGYQYKKKWEKFLVRTIGIKISKPDFISCSYKYYNDKKMQKYRNKKVLLAWTIRDKTTFNTVKNKFDNLICEYFE